MHAVHTAIIDLLNRVQRQSVALTGATETSISEEKSKEALYMKVKQLQAAVYDADKLNKELLSKLHKSG